jgi:hypothetical protein
MQSLFIFVLASFTAIQGVAIEIWNPEPIAVTVEWLQLRNDRTLHLVSKRHMAIGPGTSLEFNDTHHFVRFRYRSGSPQTWAVRDLRAKKRAQLPSPYPGGEALIVLPFERIGLRELHLQGPSAKKLDATKDVVVASALPAGTYTVTPVYDAGVGGKPFSIIVKVGESAESLAPLESVGLAQVIVDPDLCRAATRVEIRPGEAGNAPAVFDKQMNGCQVDVGGLRPGKYRALVRAGGDSVRTKAFEILPLRPTRVTVGATASVTLLGAVTLNGRPLPGALVSLREREQGMPDVELVSGITDASGRYEFALSRTGRALLTVKRGSLFQSTALTLRAGSNSFDFNILGGALAIDVRGYKDSRPLELLLEGPVTRSLRWNPSSPAPIFDGLPAGKYSLRADTPRAQDRRSLTGIVIDASGEPVKVVLDMSGPR